MACNNLPGHTFETLLEIQMCGRADCCIKGHLHQCGKCVKRPCGSRPQARSGSVCRNCVMFTPRRVCSEPPQRARCGCSACRDRSGSDSSAGPTGIGSADRSVFVDQLMTQCCEMGLSQTESAREPTLVYCKHSTREENIPALVAGPAGRPTPRWCKCTLSHCQCHGTGAHGSKLHRPPVAPALVTMAPLPSHTGLTGQVRSRSLRPPATPAPSSPNDQ